MAVSFLYSSEWIDLGTRHPNSVRQELILF